MSVAPIQMEDIPGVIRGQTITPTISEGGGRVTLSMTLFKPLPGVGHKITDITASGRNRTQAESNLVKLLKKAAKARASGPVDIGNDGNCTVQIVETAHSGGAGEQGVLARGRVRYRTTSTPGSE